MWHALPEIPTLKPITTQVRKINLDDCMIVNSRAIEVRRFSGARDEAQLYAEAYTRFLQAKRDFPELNHIGHEPRCECLPSIGMAIRDRVERDFYRTV